MALMCRSIVTCLFCLLFDMATSYIGTNNNHAALGFAAKSANRSRRTSYHNNCHKKNPSRRYSLSLGVLLPESYRRRIESSIDLALEHVHTTPNLLSDYCLRLIYKDTQCKTSLGMKSLFDLMNAGNVEPSQFHTVTHSNRDESNQSAQLFDNIRSLLKDVNEELGSSARPAALFGDVCTDVNELVAMASKYWDILHLSYAETHAKFSTADSKDLYPTFFRIVPGDRNLIRARSRLVKFFNWTRVGTIKQSDEPFYSLPHERLTTVLENSHKVKVIYTAGVSNDQINNIANELEELKRRDAHIIIADFSAQLALPVLCEAYHLRMYGANYLWIISGYHREEWWRATAAVPIRIQSSGAASTKSCTIAQIHTVLQGHFATEFAPLRSYSSKPLISNKTVTQIQRELRELCRHCPEDVYSAYAYDGIWTLALALNATLFRQKTEQRLSRPVLASHLLPHVESISFEGLTGRVRFDTNDRLGLVQILQWMNGFYSKVGFYDSAENSFFLQPLNGWVSPLDATVVKRERQYVSYYILGTMCLFSLIGILLALIFFIVNVKYRNHRFIKMSSPNMNNLIIIGSIFAYAAVFLLGVDTRFVSTSAFQKMCYAKTWVLSVGFTLAFGSMFSKTWRVHSIFANIRRDKKAIKDIQLFLIVAAILLLDVVILGAWSLISPFRISVFELPAFRHKNVLIVPELEQCVSDYSVIFQVIFYVFKGMLMIFGCFLAWETRAVNVPALNDSKYIGMCVYLVVVMCIVGLSLAFVSQEKINEAFVLISFFIVFCTTLTLLLVFMPKVIELIRARGTDQQKRYNHKRLMKSMVGSSGSGSVIRHGFSISSNGEADELSRELSFRSSEGADIKEEICSMEEDNLRLHEILVAKSTELWNLLERLRVLGESVRGENGSATICVGAQITGRVIFTEEISEVPSLGERSLQHISAYRTVGNRARQDTDGVSEIDDEEEEVLLMPDDDDEIDAMLAMELTRQNESFRFQRVRRRPRIRADSECINTGDRLRPRRKQSSVPSGLCGLLLPATSEMAKSGTVLAMTLIAGSEANFKKNCQHQETLVDKAAKESIEVTCECSRPSRRSSTLFDIVQRIRRNTTAFEYSKQRRESSIPQSRSTVSAGVQESSSRPSASASVSLLGSNDVYYEAISNFDRSQSCVEENSSGQPWINYVGEGEEEGRRYKQTAQSERIAYHLLENSISSESESLTPRPNNSAARLDARANSAGNKSSTLNPISKKSSRRRKKIPISASFT